MPITVTIEWKGQQGFEKLIRYIDNNLIYGEAQEGIRVLGHQTADKMIEIIKAEKKRPDKGTNKLEDAITAETLNTTGGVEVGIGNINKLKAEAPYYEVINSGGFVPNRGNLVPVGGFAPGESKPNAANFREGQWNVGGGNSTFKPKKPIEGIHYVDRTIEWLDKALKEFVTKLGGKFVSGLNK
jgi:hypothetical protein